MAETKTRAKTRTGPMPMDEAGMPEGQAPAIRQPQRQQPPPNERAMDRAARERREAKAKFMDAALLHREDIERSLHAQGIDFDVFLAALDIGLNQTMKNDDSFFEKVPVDAFLAEVLRAAHVGLRPDGKQGAIVRFDRGCAFLPMVEGYIEILWKTGLVADLNHNVVCEGDAFEFEEGDEGFVRHVRSLTRPANAEAIGAWCVINLMTREGAKIIEIVDQVDLRKIASVSRATNGPRSFWEREMHRKAPFRRAVKRLPKTERLSALIELDDRNVRLESSQEPAPDALSLAAIVSGRPIRQKRKREPLVVPEREALAEKPAAEKPVRVKKAAKAKKTPEQAPAFVLRAVITTKNGVQEFAPGDAELWYGDIRQKMRALEGEQLEAFWRVNKPYIEEAGRNGHGEAAMKLVELAHELGLIQTGGQDG